MLTHLFIKNFTLIDVLDMDFGKGFSVITGETGAGKSIILGAIGLLLGQRADSKSIKQGTEKCIIEAHFDLSRYQLQPFFEENGLEYDSTDCIIRRELTASGKSRSFVNDTPVPLSVLKELGERLVDVHSQHQNLLIGKQDFQLNVLDVIAADQAAYAEYIQRYTRYQDAQRRLSDMKEEIEAAKNHADYLQFQYEELAEARLSEGEQEELEQRSATMNHAEDIKSALYTADNILSGNEDSGVVTSLKQAITALRSIESVYADAADFVSRLDSSYIDLKDVAQELSGSLEDIDFDPAELESVNQRLDRIYELEKKYKVADIAGLLALQSSIKEKLSQIENSDEALAELTREVDALHDSCVQQSDVLTKARSKAARQIEKEMQQRLVPLGMPSVQFKVAMERQPLSRNGQDKVAFLFSANASSPLQPVAQVASGGEIARVMLSLKALISGAVKLPTIIFDEIDTGVSGKIAEQMARIMHEMGQQERQVISITHLPQIAAMGTSHYKVYKQETPQGTTTHMQQLSDEERVAEIAQMLSGSDVTDAAMANARQLLGAD